MWMRAESWCVIGRSRAMCDNTWMRTFSKIASFCAVALTLGSAFAQTAASNGQSTTTAKPKSTTAAKPQTTTAKPAAATALTTDEDKFSYAVGMSIARTLKAQNANINPSILAEGLKDETAGTSKLTPQEAQAILTKVQGELRAKAEARMKELAVTNKKESDDFLAANKTKPGVVTLPDGLQYKIIQAGTGPKPTATDTVNVNYVGKLVNGKEFDASEKHGGPATFEVGRVIKGWTEALQLMPVGSKWELYIPPDLAYGEQGAGGDIPPNSALVFDVDLLSIKAPEKPALEPGPDAKPATPQSNTTPNPEKK